MSSYVNRNRETVNERARRIQESWVDCRQVLRNTRNTMYIVTILTVILLVALLLNWNRNLLILNSAALMIMSAYGSLVVSNKSCIRIFDDGGVSTVAQD